VRFALTKHTYGSLFIGFYGQRFNGIQANYGDLADFFNRSLLPVGLFEK
jgi:hypothetical protein